jgi:hypothetical protein
MKKFACMALVAMASCCSTKPEVIVAKPQEPAVVEAAPVEAKPAPVLVEKQEPFIVPEQKPEPVAVVEEKPVVMDNYSKTISIVFSVFLSILAVLCMIWLDYRKKSAGPAPALPLSEETPSETADK